MIVPLLHSWWGPQRGCGRHFERVGWSRGWRRLLPIQALRRQIVRRIRSIGMWNPITIYVISSWGSGSQSSNSTKIWLPQRVASSLKAKQDIRLQWSSTPSSSSCHLNCCRWSCCRCCNYYYRWTPKADISHTHKLQAPLKFDKTSVTLANIPPNPIQ